MKKLIFVLIALVISVIASAQNDTTVVNNNKVTFEKEEYYADFYRYLEQHKHGGISFEDALGFLYEKQE